MTAECAGYRLGVVLGRGGSGTVYAAEQGSRRAAVKLLHPEHAASRPAVRRFLHEARAAAAIVDPGIVEVYDAGFDEHGRAFIAMELLEGESLAASIARPPGVALSTLRQVGCAIAGTVGAAHGRNIVHRDLKPENVFLAHGGVKVLDFGMAKLDPEQGPYSFVTDRGTLVGTPAYMSPEQCRGGEVDARSDVYALGCILYEMACGRPPFVEGGLGMVLGAHVYQPPRPPSDFAELPSALEQLLLRSLEKDPARRPPSMHALASALASAS
ncbi:MAG TPA: serine/threonine-protein kinase [Polyangiales bacterium]|nr:serine/threonine-protein kinase [Polyangiales bacterium]